MMGRDHEIGCGRLIACWNLDPSDFRGGRADCRVRLCGDLPGRGRADGKAVRVPNLLQMQRRMREAFQRDHGEQENEGEGEGAPTLREGRKESQCTRGKR